MAAKEPQMLEPPPLPNLLPMMSGGKMKTLREETAQQRAQRGWDGLPGKEEQPAEGESHRQAVLK